MSRTTGVPGPYQLETAGRIRAERERLGLSQSEAARRLGIPRPSYQLLEVAANPTLLTLTELVEILGMDLRNIAPRLLPTKRQRHASA